MERIIVEQWKITIEDEFGFCLDNINNEKCLVTLKSLEHGLGFRIMKDLTIYNSNRIRISI